MNNKVLRTLFIYNGIFVLAGSLLSPLYAVYVEKFQSGVMWISISWSVFLVSTTIFIFVLSRMGDKVKDKRHLLLGGYFVRGVAWLLFVFADSIFMLLVLQSLLGLGEALGSPAFDAMFAENLEKGKHIADYSNWKIITNMTVAAGTIAGGFIVSKMGFSVLFLAMSLLAMISFFGILLEPKKFSLKKYFLIYKE